MLRYIIRRLILLVPVIVIVGTIVFVLIHSTPGDPAAVILGPDATTELEALRDRLGLNEPLIWQYLHWFSDALRLDFGESIFPGQPVTEALIDRAQPTLLLSRSTR